MKPFLAIAVFMIGLSSIQAFAYESSAWAGLDSGNLISSPCKAAKDLAILNAAKACLNAKQKLMNDYIVGDCESRTFTNSSTQNFPGMTQTTTERFPVKYVTVTYRCGE